MSVFKYDEYKNPTYTESGAVTDARDKRDEHYANKPGEYMPSDKVTGAEAARDEHYANKPGDFSFSMQGSMDELMEKILGREDFSYDINSDALYNQYKDKYIKQGRMAMADVMGQAAAMTGGYGNSYAAAVGNQAYGASLEKLNDIVPELYSMALDRYIEEGQDLYNQYGLLSDRYSNEYGIYRDSVSDWNTELGYLSDIAEGERAFDYGAYRDGVADWQNMLGYYNGVYEGERSYDRGAFESDRAFDYGTWSDGYNRAYGEYRDGVDDEYRDKVFESSERQTAYSNLASMITSSGYTPTESELEAAGMTSKQATAYRQMYDSAVAQAQSEERNARLQGIEEKAASFTSNNDLGNYLDKLEANGVITSEESDEIYIKNMTLDKAALNNRDWTLVEGGGVNWFGGVDGNAKFKDQYGNTYTGEKLLKALKNQGMGDKEAKNYIKSLQNSLGA